MKRAVITGERSACLVDAPNPSPKDDWVLVKVQAAPMCAEYKSFVAGHRSDFLGHEASGEVADVAQACGVRKGDRVVVMPQYPCGRCSLCLSGEYIHCENVTDFAKFTGSNEGRATMAQYLLKPASLLIPIPDGMSYEHASLACCGLGPSFGAFQLMGLSAFDTVLITGLGPVGLGAVVNARFRRSRVIAVDLEEWRIERARQMGADLVLDPRDPDILTRIRDATEGKGVDCAVDCSGTIEGERLCIESARRKGKVTFIGECTAELTLKASPNLIRKGLTLLGSWHYNLRDVPKVIKVIRDSPLIELLISHVMPMTSIQEAFEISASHQCAKIILKPH